MFNDRDSTNDVVPNEKSMLFVTIVGEVRRFSLLLIHKHQSFIVHGIRRHTLGAVPSLESIPTLFPL